MGYLHVFYCALPGLTVISKILVLLGILDISSIEIPFSVAIYLNAFIVTDESLNGL